MIKDPEKLAAEFRRLVEEGGNEEEAMKKICGQEDIPKEFLSRLLMAMQCMDPSEPVVLVTKKMAMASVDGPELPAVLMGVKKIYKQLKAEFDRQYKDLKD
jgi:hypothetical protein